MSAILNFTNEYEEYIEKDIMNPKHFIGILYLVILLSRDLV